MENGVTSLQPGLVSVVMPAHMAELFLAESIRSVLLQTLPNWELIVIDDASTDRTFAIASEFTKSDSRIRVIRLDKNAGVADARNVGIAAARGQYLAFLDSDDLWLPQKLEVQIDYMERTGAGFCFSSYRRLSLDGSVGHRLRVPALVSYKQLLKGNVIGCLTVVIDRRQIPVVKMEKVGHEDYVAWLSVLRDGHIAHGIQSDLARYRLSLSSVSGNKKRSARWTWKIYRKIEKLPLHVAIWCFANYSLRAVLNRIGE